MQIWLFVNVCHWGCHVLERNPEAIGLTILQPILEIGYDNVIDLLKAKHYIEVSMIVLCLPGWVFGMCVPFFSIVAV